MDAGFWAARVHSSKYISAVQSSNIAGNNHNRATEDEGSDEVIAWIPCPYCYVEIELHLLCVHLQEEHCFDLKNAVCPMCAADLGKDALAHFTVQHSHSVKRRRRSQKSGFWSNISADVVGDFRDLSSFLGNNNNNGRGRVSNNEPAPDPLLSPFICGVPLNDDHKTDHTVDLKREGSVLDDDEGEGDNSEEKKQRAVFVQEILMSTIFY